MFQGYENKTKDINNKSLFKFNEIYKLTVLLFFF